MKTKVLKGKQIEFKEEEEKGRFKAIFATLNVKDKDGDVIVSGAIEEGKKVKISAYNHESWFESLPVGKGTIHEIEDKLIVDGKFFLSTQAGQEHYNTIKELEDLTEYSFGFDVLEEEPGKFNEEQVNFLKSLDVHEVSPVIMGAGVNTRTMEIKKTKEAIPQHETETIDKEWSASDEESALTNEGGYTVYRNMYAWVDPAGSKEAKSSYKFPHHEVGEDGIPGKANVRACIAVIASLNGARGGADIPDADRQKVYNHVVKHLNDAGEEPPELKNNSKKHIKFSDQIAELREDSKKVLNRCHDIIKLRKSEGKDLGKESKQLMKELEKDFYEYHKKIDDMLSKDEVQELYLKHLKQKYGGKNE